MKSGKEGVEMGESISERRGVADRIKGAIEEKWEKRNRRVSLFQAWQRKLPVTEKDAAM